MRCVAGYPLCPLYPWALGQPKSLECVGGKRSRSHGECMGICEEVCELCLVLLLRVRVPCFGVSKAPPIPVVSTAPAEYDVESALIPFSVL